MSRHWRNSLVCKGCGCTYRGFKTGLTYRDVFLWYWSFDPDASTWRYKRRHTILGKWHQHKKEMWGEHVYHCEKSAREQASCAPVMARSA